MGLSFLSRGPLLKSLNKASKKDLVLQKKKGPLCSLDHSNHISSCIPIRFLFWKIRGRKGRDPHLLPFLEHVGKDRDPRKGTNGNDRVTIPSVPKTAFSTCVCNKSNHPTAPFNNKNRMFLLKKTHISPTTLL